MDNKLLDIIDEYGVYPNNTDTVINPIRFAIKNKEFPVKNTTYDSNVLTFVKPIQYDWVEEGRYYISSKGVVYDLKLNKPVPVVCSAGNSYRQQVNLKTSDSYRTYQKIMKVHRLVMEHFDPIDNPENYQVNHMDGNTTNNNTSNLEWCTSQYNRIHSLINGLEDTMYGKPVAKLYPDDIRKIKQLRDQGYSYNAIIDELGLKERHVDRHTLSDIINGTSIFSNYYED